MLIGFTAAHASRWARIALGASMVAGGLTAGTPVGWAIAALGLVPIVSGAVDVRLLRGGGYSVAERQRR